MKKCVVSTIATLALFLLVSNSYAIKAGVYTKLFSNGIFSVVPPDGFEDFKRKPNGAEFWGKNKKISFSITYVDYSSLSGQFSDDQLLDRFESSNFYQGFKHGFNSISTRSISSHEIKTIREKKVLEFSAIDPSGKTTPTKNIIYYRNGIEIRISLSAPSSPELDANDELLAKLIYTINVN